MLIFTQASDLQDAKYAYVVCMHSVRIHQAIFWRVYEHIFTDFIVKYVSLLKDITYCECVRVTDIH